MIYFLAVLTVFLRLLPHEPNFAPLGALALLAGTTGDRSKIWLPLAAVVVTDAVLGFYSGMTWVYLSYGILFFTGYFCRRASRPGKQVALPLAGSVLFFLVSNLGVWASGSMYPATLTGLGQCYTAGLPFFRNTAVSDLIYFNAFAVLTASAHYFRLRRPFPVRP